MDGPVAAVEMSMAASTDGRYSRTAELGPCFPDERARGALLERAAALVAESHRLEAAGGQLAVALQPLVLTLNACSSGVLDGCSLRPSEIEQAVAGHYDEDPGRARAQSLARAHIIAESVLSAALPTKRVGLYAPEFVQCIHAELHRAIVSAELGEEASAVALEAGSAPPDAASAPPGAFGPSSAALSGVQQSAGLAAQADEDADPDSVPFELTEPGGWRLLPARDRDAAPAEQIPELCDAWQGVYSVPLGLEQALVAAFCAERRLLWVRPFAHGNGRTAHLHTQLVLTALGATRGLWSPLRGMARDRDGYHALVQQPRGDGSRAARHEREREELERYSSWMLDICLAEARAARELLDTERLKGRLSDLLAWLGARPWTMGSEKSVIKPDALEALHYAAITGPVERARFIAMLGLQHRTGRRVLSSLIDFGLLVSESSRAPVRFNLPPASLRFLLPGFWPEAGAEEPMSASGWPQALTSASSHESAAE
jgi:hypothetical protein